MWEKKSRKSGDNRRSQVEPSNSDRGSPATKNCGICGICSVTSKMAANYVRETRYYFSHISKMGMEMETGSVPRFSFLPAIARGRNRNRIKCEVFKGGLNGFSVLICTLSAHQSRGFVHTLLPCEACYVYAVYPK